MDTAQIIEALETELNAVNAAISALSGSRTGKRRGRPPGKGKRTMSAEARAKISAAQKARWKKQKAKG
jgi:hypothetical protein